MKCAIVRVVVYREESAFRVFHDAEVVVDVLLRTTGGDDVVVWFPGTIDIIRGIADSRCLARIPDRAVSGRGCGGGVRALLAYVIGVRNEGRIVSLALVLVADGFCFEPVLLL